jgi:PAS domain S-box-containing protein
VISWNFGAEQVLGWAEAEMLGHDLSRLFAENGIAQLRSEMATAQSHGRGGGEEGWRCRKDGTLFWAVGEMTPIQSDDGRVIGFTKILRDRTTQREADDKLREERRTLELLNRIGSAIAGGKDLQRLIAKNGGGGAAHWRNSPRL